MPKIKAANLPLDKKTDDLAVRSPPSGDDW